MKIKWYGQAAFLITSENGTRIITDPYAPNDTLRYDEINESADIVTVSHGHFDHNNVAAVKGSPAVIREAGEAKGIQFKAVHAFHDSSGGAQRGAMTIFCFQIDGINICHLGDLGHPLDARQVEQLGKVDILLIPVGGNYTIDARAATAIYEALSPMTVIPMHFKNARCPDFPVAGVEEFIKGKTNVTSLEGSEVEIKTGAIPADTRIVVLTPAR